MNLEELRTATAATRELSEKLVEEVMAFHSFINKIEEGIHHPQISPTIDVDAFVALQTPVYNAHLATIEAAAADALGADN